VAVLAEDDLFHHRRDDKRPRSGDS
jgi:hypothetical protein